MKKVSVSQSKIIAEKSPLARGWCWVELGELAALEPNAITDGPFGSKLKTEHYTDSGPRVIRLKNIGDGAFRDERAYIAESHFLSLQKHRVEAGDLVVAALGEDLPRACVIPDWVGPAIVKADCIRIKPNQNLAFSKYLNFALNFEQTRKRAGRIIHGVGRPRLNLSEIKSIEVPLAPSQEQRRIVAKIEELFSDLDAGVAALERVRANLKRYRAAVLKAAVEGKLTEDWRARHSDTEPASVLLERILTERRRQWESNQLAKFAQAGNQLPKGWQEKYTQPERPRTVDLEALPRSWVLASLDGLCPVFSDCPHRTPKYSEGGYPALCPRDLVEGRLDLEKAERVPQAEYELQTAKRVPSQGDVIYSRELSFGWAVVVPHNTKLCMSQGMALFRPATEIQVRYFMNVINGPLGRQQSKDAAVGSAHPHINLGDIKRYAIPVPPTVEQIEILSEIERRLSVVDQIEAQITANLKRAARLRQGILKRAFEGRLVPQDPSDEPAETLLERIREQRQAAPASKNGRKPGRPRQARSGRVHSNTPLFDSAKQDAPRPIPGADDGDDPGGAP